MIQHIPNLNLISIHNFAPYMRKINSDDIGAIKLWDSCLESFEEILKELEQCENGETVISLENLRNETLEQFLDSIDEHLNYDFSKWYGQLEQIGLDEKDVLRHIPEYNAALNITGTTEDNDPLFHTRGVRIGHIWSVENYRTILNRLALPEVRDSIALLGLTDCVFALRAIDKKLMGETREYELLNRIREERHEYSKGIRLSFSDSRYEKQLFKKRKQVNIAELVIRELKTQYEIQLMEQFAPNNLTYSEYYKLLAELNEASIQESKQALWRDKAKEVVQTFLNSFRQFSQIDSWSELEQYERKLFKAVEQFHFVLLDYTRMPIISDYPDLWKEYESAPRFKRAYALIMNLWDKGFYIDIDAFRSRPSVSLRELQILLSLGVTDAFASKIEQLGLTPLFNEISSLERHTRDICLKECIPYSHLEKLRFQREHATILHGLLMMKDPSFPTLEELVAEFGLKGK